MTAATRTDREQSQRTRRARRLLTLAVALLCVAALTTSVSPARATEARTATIRWGETVRWSGTLNGSGAFVTANAGNLGICLEGPCDQFLLDIQVTPSRSSSLVRFVQLDVQTARPRYVDLAVFPPDANLEKDGTYYVRDSVRLFEPSAGVWRIHLRCWEVCEKDAYTVTATTGAAAVPRAVAHRVGAKAARSPGATADAPVARVRQVANAFEPTLGFTDDGTIFYQGTTASDLPIPQVLRSRDGGTSWENVAPRVGPTNRHPTSQSAYLHVDSDTGRAFTIDQLPPCNEVSFSDDQGGSWVTSGYCHNAPDHQTLFTGRPVSSPTTVYDNLVYVCARTMGGDTTTCSKSLDGGVTFAPTGTPPFGGLRGLDGCGYGYVGHGVVGPDGTVFLPRGSCGQPEVAISKDEGMTWTRVQVAHNGIATDPVNIGVDPPAPEAFFTHKTGVDVDDNGTLYYTWIAADRLPYLSVSKDGGLMWGEPMMIAPPGVNETVLPAIAVGSAGRVAIAYMGTKDSPGGPPFPDSASDYAAVRWNGYIAMSTSVLEDDPTFFSAPVNDPADPLVVGYCGAFSCSDAGHFFDIAIAPDGTPWAAFVDVCVVATCDLSPGVVMPSEGIVGHLVGGPSLRL